MQLWVLVIITAAFVAGFAVACLLRSARPLRKLTAASGGIEIEATDPINLIRHKLPTAPLPPQRASLGDGPLIPDGETQSGSRT
jgi:HAMP domain-containing protein